jgi:hypothetical protein
MTRIVEEEQKLGGTDQVKALPLLLRRNSDKEQKATQLLVSRNEIDDDIEGGRRSWKRHGYLC